MTEPAALAGIRVLECATGVAGPLAGMLLADHGADVVKVEPPGGDPGRADPGFPVWNRGKRSVTVDPAAADDRRLLEDLLAAADLCIAGAPSPALAGTPLDPEAAPARHRRLVYLHTPPYTDDAPWAGGAESDALLAAMTGTALRQFSCDGGPVDDVYPHLVTVQGVWAAAAAVAALHDRERTGCGRRVTVAGVHAVMVAGAGALTFDAGAPPTRPAGPAGGTPYYRLYQCADGLWLFLAALIPRFTQRAFEALGVADLLTDPRLGPVPRAAMLTGEHAPWVTARLAEAFRSRRRAEWLEVMAAAGCPVGPVLRRDDWLDHPQLAAIGMRVEVDDPVHGPVVMPGVPLVLTATPGRVAGPAPAPPGEAAPSPPPPAPPPSAAASAGPSGRPLDGVVVLDLGAIIAGPFAASLLAELGADVVKVEPLGGDSFRGPGFAAYNKGQRSVAIDLSDGRGRAALLRLVAGADVVIDNYRPGVLQRLGIGYDALRQANPDIITVTITGFGEGGPLGQEAGFDPVLQAMSGMMAAQGGDDDPVFFAIPVNDVAAAATAALGACLALHHRARGGAGQRVWTSLAAMSALMQARELARLPGGPRLPRGGRDHKGPGPADRYFEVADGWVRVQSTGSGEFGDALAVGLAPLTREAACRALTGARVPAAPARTGAELAGDADLLSYGVLQPDPRPARTGWWTTGDPVRLNGAPERDPLVPPALGQHTVEVLRAAGMDQEEIEALLEAGAVAQAGRE